MNNFTFFTATSGKLVGIHKSHFVKNDRVLSPDEQIKLNAFEADLNFDEEFKKTLERESKLLESTRYLTVSKIHNTSCYILTTFIVDSYQNEPQQKTPHKSTLRHMPISSPTFRICYSNSNWSKFVNQTGHDIIVFRSGDILTYNNKSRDFAIESWVISEREYGESKYCKSYNSRHVRHSSPRF